MGKCPLQMGKMPLFVGKAVALQRGNFRALIYVIKALFYAVETRNWAQMNAISEGVHLKLDPASYDKQEAI